jgi:hypothetical protein
MVATALFVAVAAIVLGLVCLRIFVGTLDALARTQDVFGRKTVAPLKAILEAELSGFGAQASISGCYVELTPSAGQDFSLIFHELATREVPRLAPRPQPNRLRPQDASSACQGNERGP